jgi:hypothetical protein
MNDITDPKNTDKPVMRCSECDRETVHYNTFVMPDNEERVVCWECLERQEKNFNAKPGFQRESRRGTIPR